MQADGLSFSNRFAVVYSRFIALDFENVLAVAAGQGCVEWVLFPYIAAAERNEKDMKEWILASASPRRKELLKEIVSCFEIIPAKGEEKVDEQLVPSELVKALATQKAREVASLPIAKGKIVLGADTVVALGNTVLGKPKDEQDAKEMLRALSGKTHCVYTGVCISVWDGENRIELAQTDCTNVTFFVLSEQFIDEYVASGSPMDKAGAYGIQDGGLVEKIDGSYSNVVGLPIELCRKLVSDMGSLLS